MDTWTQQYLAQICNRWLSFLDSGDEQAADIVFGIFIDRINNTENAKKW